MAAKFRGTTTGKMDDKARVLIPSPFRKVLAEGATGPQVELILVHGPHLGNHAEGYSAAAFERIEERVDAMPRGELRRMMERMVIGASHTLVVDESGRIVLPPKVRARCGLPVSPAKGETANVCLLGQGERFTLWREDLFDEGAEDDAAALARLKPGASLMDALDDHSLLDADG